MAAKKPAVRSPKPAPKTTKATQPQQKRAQVKATSVVNNRSLRASKGATATQTAETARVTAPATGTQNRGKNNSDMITIESPVPSQPQEDADSRLADAIASAEVVVQLKPQPAPTASPLAAKIAYLRELITDDAALADALQRGAVKVQVPGLARTRRLRREPHERPKTRKVFAPALVKRVRELRRQGHSYAQCEALAGMKPDKGRTAWMIVNNYQGPEA